MAGRVTKLREHGAPFAAIADQLNAEGVPTARRYPATVRAVLSRYSAPGYTALTEGKR